MKKLSYKDSFFIYIYSAKYLSKGVQNNTGSDSRMSMLSNNQDKRTDLQC